MVQFYTRSSLHLVGELAELGCLTTGAGAEMAFLAGSIFRVRLSPEARSNIIGLVSVWSSLIVVGSAGLGQGPSWEILVAGRVGRGFGNVPAGTHAVWS